MSVNGVTESISSLANTKNSKTEAKVAANTTKAAVKDNNDTKQKEATNSAAVYEKTEQTVEDKKIYKRDTATLDKLMADSDKRSKQMRDLVEKMLLKQGETLTDATDIYALLREGKVEVDPKTSAKAKEDIAEDGYWGVNKTSDRLVSFAIALSGGDPSKADEMIAAVQKGFKEATKAWGDELPQISKDTLEATNKKLVAWKNSLNSDRSMDTVAKNTFSEQAAASKVAE